MSCVLVCYDVMLFLDYVEFYDYICVPDILFVFVRVYEYLIFCF